MLYQLSYITILVVLNRFELMTFHLSGERSNQLSYRTIKAVWTGFEPATLCVTGRYSNQLNYQTFICGRCRIRTYDTFQYA